MSQARAVGASGVTDESTSPVQERIAWLDGWRGLAILGVLAGHFLSQAFPSSYVLGGYGVELFFVLSGRLMGEILFVDRPLLIDFFRRRFARIVPALMIYATAMALYAVAASPLVRTPLMRPWEYLSAITFTINYAQALGGDVSNLLGHTWSLAVEEHSYVILAVLALALSRQASKARWLLAAVGVLALINGIRLFESGAGGVHEIYWRTDVRIAPIFLSAATYLFLYDVKLSERTGRLLGYLPLAFIPLSLALFFQDSITLTYTSSAVLLALSVNLLGYGPVWLRQFLSLRLLTTLGLISYSVYLWQEPFYRLASTARMMTPVAVGASIACGLFSFHVVERPMRSWINGLRIATRSQKPVGSPASAIIPPD